MAIFIRNAEITDMERLQGVFQRASLSNEQDRGLLVEHPEWLVLSSEGVEGGRTRVAVDDDGSVVGFATYLVVAGVAELEDLFVDPPWMRRGIASALVADVALLLNERDFDTLEVTANPHALSFYRQAGFVEIGTVDTQGYPVPRMGRPTEPSD